MSIPLHIITGFFGSGKTSFLKHYLGVFGKQKRIAVVQNEFSSSNIDGKELSLSKNYKILEINNGSVFCVCLLGSFIDSLADFVDEIKPDEVIMEASGMSDPVGVAQMFQSEKLSGKVYLGYVWSVVDSYNFHKLSALRNRLNHQLRIADTIILNKVDLVESQLGTIAGEIKKVNPFARVLESSYGKIDLSIMKKGFNLFPDLGEESEGRPDIESVVIKSSREISSENLSGFLEEVREGMIRCKGFVKLKSGRTAFVQGVFDDYKIEDIAPVKEPTELVLIGDFIVESNFQLLYEGYCK
jgi:G3E family GTPase